MQNLGVALNDDDSEALDTLCDFVEKTIISVSSVTKVANSRGLMEQRVMRFDDWYATQNEDHIDEISAREGWNAANCEARDVLLALDNLATQWGDEAIFRRCRDRLRDLTREA
jgi:hypothetical protein